MFKLFINNESISCKYNFDTDETTIAPSFDYNLVSDIFKLDFLQDAIVLLIKEYNETMQDQENKCIKFNKSAKNDKNI